MREPYRRRDFLKTVAVGGALASTWTARSYASIPGANERLRAGIIGCGGMANAHMNSLLAMKDRENVEIVAVCDLYRKRLDAAAKKTGGKPYRRYQDVLALKEVDYVLVATPEHWHHRMILDAIDAEKHIYTEKPMTRTIKEAQEVVRKMEGSKLKVQVGVQGMSDESYKTANELIRDGVLGKVVMAQIDYSRNHEGDFWMYPIDEDAKPGPDLDWETWLGPAKKRPWDPKRFFQWRRYWDYCGGIASDLFVHRVTRIIKSVGLTYPDRVVATGGMWFFTESVAEVPDTFNMLCDYPGGPTVVLISSMANNTPINHYIRGQKATLQFNNDGFVVTPQELRPLAPGKMREAHQTVYRKKGAEDITPHHQNHHNAIRKGDELNCDVMLGLYGVVVTAMGVESFRKQQYLKWNAAKQKVEKA